MPWGIALGALGAGLGAAQSIAGKRAAGRQNAARLQEMRYSPFTGRQEREYTKSPSVLGGVAGGALQGFNIYKGLSEFQNNRDLTKAKLAENAAKTNYFKSFNKPQQQPLNPSPYMDTNYIGPYNTPGFTPVNQNSYINPYSAFSTLP